MIPELRKQFNKAFSNQRHAAFLAELESLHPGQIDFRIAETPVFIPVDFRRSMESACNNIIDLIMSPGFKKMTDAAIPEKFRIPGNSDYSPFICFDFGICKNELGKLEPQLIEMQGFPSLFAHQVLFPEVMGRHYDFPENFSPFLSGLNKESYLNLLGKILVGDQDPEEVVLLDIQPQSQKTRIDFYCTEDYFGIHPVCLTEIESQNGKLFYRREGKTIRIRRIYNRLIFDELMQQPAAIQEKAAILFRENDVEWLPHPDWFYRISKYTLPFIDHPNVPQTSFVNQLGTIPGNLEDYVLKPLFSFAGQGVIIDVKEEDIRRLPDPENWILQKKVEYASVIETPNEPAKAEIRLFYFQEEAGKRPIPVNNLARLSKGKMVGVRYNKDKDWVGGSFCLFEQG